MSEHEDIEKKLREFREGRDAGMPADRRLLPVHKDRLLAEARKKYAQGGAERFWGLFIRPTLRWAVVAAPILLLAAVGVFWISNERAPKRRAMERLKASDEKRTEAAKQLVFGDKRLDEPAAQPTRAPAAAEPLLAKESGMARNKVEAAKAPAASAPASPEIGQAALDLSGVYRQRAGAMAVGGEADQLGPRSRFAEGATESSADLEGDDRDHSGLKREAKADSGRPKSSAQAAQNLATFTVVQTADMLKLTDAMNNSFVGRIQQAAVLKDQNAAAEKPAAVQQVLLTGTNQVTNQRQQMIALFYLEESVPAAREEVPQKKARVAGKLSDQLQQNRKAARVRMVLQNLDEQQNVQGLAAEAERVSPAE